MNPVYLPSFPAKAAVLFSPIMISGHALRYYISFKNLFMAHLRFHRIKHGTVLIGDREDHTFQRTGSVPRQRPHVVRDAVRFLLGQILQNEICDIDRLNRMSPAAFFIVFELFIPAENSKVV